MIFSLSQIPLLKFAFCPALKGIQLKSVYLLLLLFFFFFFFFCFFEIIYMGLRLEESKGKKKKKKTRGFMYFNVNKSCLNICIFGHHNI